MQKNRKIGFLYGAAGILMLSAASVNAFLLFLLYAAAFGPYAVKYANPASTQVLWILLLISFVIALISGFLLLAKKSLFASLIGAISVIAFSLLSVVIHNSVGELWQNVETPAIALSAVSIVLMIVSYREERSARAQPYA